MPQYDIWISIFHNILVFFYWGEIDLKENKDTTDIQQMAVQSGFIEVHDWAFNDLYCWEIVILNWKLQISQKIQENGHISRIVTLNTDIVSYHEGGDDSHLEGLSSVANWTTILTEPGNVPSLCRDIFSLEKRLASDVSCCYWRLQVFRRPSWKQSLLSSSRFNGR